MTSVPCYGSSMSNEPPITSAEAATVMKDLSAAFAALAGAVEATSTGAESCPVETDQMSAARRLLMDAGFIASSNILHRALLTIDKTEATR